MLARATHPASRGASRGRRKSGPRGEDSPKIRATVHNAQTLLELDTAHGGFEKYLQSFPTYAALSADIKRRFKFMGEMNVWYFLFRVREPVPKFEKWVTTIPGEHPRMKEMVERARHAGTSTER